jgi:tetratricopeptide (TPR) repeat protein
LAAIYTDKIVQIMKLTITLIFLTQFVYCQGYFNGKELHCPTTNTEAKRLFDGGIEILHLNRDLKPKYLAMNAEVFARAILQDTTFCDAYFFAGYILNLQHQYLESFAFLKVADTLSPKPILIYKQNLAAICMKVGLFNDARKTYAEMVKHFPESPEGYYGVAATSPMIGDYKFGLENISMAETKYHDNEYENQINYLKGILLTLDSQYPKAKEMLEKVNGSYKRDLNFNIHYSLTLLKISELNNDSDLKKKAKKFYDKIDDKSIIPANLKSEFRF